MDITLREGGQAWGKDAEVSVGVLLSFKGPWDTPVEIPDRQLNIWVLRNIVGFGICSQLKPWVWLNLPGVTCKVRGRGEILRDYKHLRNQQR